MSKLYITESNPAIEHASTGVEANHSTTVPSLEHLAPLDGQHPQSDDEYNDLPSNIDPNLSGTTPTDQMCSWLAGSMNGWSENDDYRTFLETGDWPVSRLIPEYCQKDQDYDDNGGIPLAIGHTRGDVRDIAFHDAATTPTEETFNIGISPRRI